MANDARTVLVIEDDADIRDLMAAVLQRSGFRVRTASTGADGVAAVRLQDPDVVTLDTGLPDGDGLDVAREIRGVSDAPIILVSGSCDLPSVVAGLGIDRCGYLAKPFLPRNLCQRVEEAVAPILT
jgi:DNA-binding response OmpR family regulator